MLLPPKRSCLLTGCRRNEILTLRWEHVDLDKAEMRIVDGKTGARTVHLSPSAVRVLEGIVKLIECRLFSAFLHEAKLLNLRGGAIDNVPRFRSESG